MILYSVRREHPNRNPDTSGEALEILYHRLLDRADMLEQAADGLSGEARRRVLEDRERCLDAFDPDRPASSGDPVYDAWCAAMDAGLDPDEAEALVDQAQAKEEQSWVTKKHA